MQKNFRCPGCGNSMEFLPAAQKMYCAYCGSMYTVEELNAIMGDSGDTAADGAMTDSAGDINTIDPWAAALGQLPSNAEANAEENAEKNEGGTQNKKEELLDDSWLYGGGPEEAGANGSSGWGNQANAAFMGEMDPEKRKEMERRHATIQMKIMHCNACGAELAVNGVETSSFCVYCGQATVVMDRVEDYLQPDYIMPFKITKEQAEQIIRSRISEGFFIPDGIKNFEIDKLRGIYIPFWLFDMYYGDDQYWKYTVKKGKSTVTRYSHRTGDCYFNKMTLDASKNFNDDSSQRLEPYHMEDLLEFDPAYLSGFYSDRFDVGTDDLVTLAYNRAKEMFDESVKKTLHHQGAKQVYSIPLRQVTKREYALLPVWFLTFRYEEKPYTILVNGQTGKMVGAVPYVKTKAYSIFAVLTVVFCVAFAFLGAYLTPGVLDSDEGRIVGGYFSIVGLAIYSTWSIAIKKYRALLKSIGLTQSGTTSKFVRERADK